MLKKKVRLEKKLKICSFIGKKEKFLEAKMLRKLYLGEWRQSPGSEQGGK
jgi:hypothetical protein